METENNRVKRKLQDSMKMGKVREVVDKTSGNSMRMDTGHWTLDSGRAEWRMGEDGRKQKEGKTVSEGENER